MILSENKNEKEILIIYKDIIACIIKDNDINDLFENIKKVKEFSHFLIELENGWTAIDNSHNEAFTEDFDTLQEAVSWLNYEFEVPEIETEIESGVE